MHKDFCKELGNPYFSDEDEKRAVKQSTFWEAEGDEIIEHFCKPIRTPRQEAFWGGKGYNSHPKQELDK